MDVDASSVTRASRAPSQAMCRAQVASDPHGPPRRTQRSSPSTPSTSSMTASTEMSQGSVTSRYPPATPGRDSTHPWEINGPITRAKNSGEVPVATARDCRGRYTSLGSALIALMAMSDRVESSSRMGGGYVDGGAGRQRPARVGWESVEDPPSVGRVHDETFVGESLEGDLDARRVDARLLRDFGDRRRPCSQDSDGGSPRLA